MVILLFTVLIMFSRSFDEAESPVCALDEIVVFTRLVPARELASAFNK
jgi:hypothetical protein